MLNWALGYALRGDRYPLLLALKSSRSRCKIPLLSQPLRLNFAPLCPQLAAHILIASGRPAECVKMKPRKGRRRKGNESPPSFLPSFRVLATPTTLTRLRNFGDRSGKFCVHKLIVSTLHLRFGNCHNTHKNNHQTCHQLSDDDNDDDDEMALV